MSLYAAGWQGGVRKKRPIGTPPGSLAHTLSRAGRLPESLRVEPKPKARPFVAIFVTHVAVGSKKYARCMEEGPKGVTG